MAKVIYTIGYDARPINEFIGLLKYYGIRCVVDVRRFPKSRFPEYNRENLCRLLESNGIRYIWLGEKLGGFRGGYIRYMGTREFWEGIKSLIEVAESMDVIAIMCRERIPWRCHRRHIASALKTLGYRIIHIIDKDVVQEHKYTIEKYGIKPPKML